MDDPITFKRMRVVRCDPFLGRSKRRTTGETYAELYAKAKAKNCLEMRKLSDSSSAVRTHSANMTSGETGAISVRSSTGAVSARSPRTMGSTKSPGVTSSSKFTAGSGGTASARTISTGAPGTSSVRHIPINTSHMGPHGCSLNRNLASYQSSQVDPNQIQRFLSHPVVTIGKNTKIGNDSRTQEDKKEARSTETNDTQKTIPRQFVQQQKNLEINTNYLELPLSPKNRVNTMSDVVQREFSKPRPQCDRSGSPRSMSVSASPRPPNKRVRMKRKGETFTLGKSKSRDRNIAKVVDAVLGSSMSNTNISMMNTTTMITSLGGSGGGSSVGVGAGGSAKATTAGPKSKFDRSKTYGGSKSPHLAGPYPTLLTSNDGQETITDPGENKAANVHKDKGSAQTDKQKDEAPAIATKPILKYDSNTKLKNDRHSVRSVAKICKNVLSPRSMSPKHVATPKHASSTCDVKPFATATTKPTIAFGNRIGLAPPFLSAKMQVLSTATNSSVVRNATAVMMKAKAGPMKATATAVSARKEDGNRNNTTTEESNNKSSGPMGFKFEPKLRFTSIRSSSSISRNPITPSGLSPSNSIPSVKLQSRSLSPIQMRLSESVCPFGVKSQATLGNSLDNSTKSIIATIQIGSSKVGSPKSASGNYTPKQQAASKISDPIFDTVTDTTLGATTLQGSTGTIQQTPKITSVATPKAVSKVAAPKGNVVTPKAMTPKTIGITPFVGLKKAPPMVSPMMPKPPKISQPIIGFGLTTKMASQVRTSSTSQVKKNAPQELIQATASVDVSNGDVIVSQKETNSSVITGGKKTAIKPKKVATDGRTARAKSTGKSLQSSVESPPVLSRQLVQSPRVNNPDSLNRTWGTDDMPEEPDVLAKSSPVETTFKVPVTPVDSVAVGKPSSVVPEKVSTENSSFTVTMKHPQSVQKLSVVKESLVVAAKKTPEPQIVTTIFESVTEKAKTSNSCLDKSNSHSSDSVNERSVQQPQLSSTSVHEWLAVQSVRESFVYSVPDDGIQEMGHNSGDQEEGGAHLGDDLPDELTDLTVQEIVLAGMPDKKASEKIEKDSSEKVEKKTSEKVEKKTSERQRIEPKKASEKRESNMVKEGQVLDEFEPTPEEGIVQAETAIIEPTPEEATMSSGKDESVNEAKQESCKSMKEDGTSKDRKDAANSRTVLKIGCFSPVRKLDFQPLKTFQIPQLVLPTMNPASGDTPGDAKTPAAAGKVPWKEDEVTLKQAQQKKEDEVKADTAEVNAMKQDTTNAIEESELAIKQAEAVVKQVISKASDVKKMPLKIDNLKSMDLKFKTVSAEDPISAFPGSPKSPLNGSVGKMFRNTLSYNTIGDCHRNSFEKTNLITRSEHLENSVVGNTGGQMLSNSFTKKATQSESTPRGSTLRGSTPKGKTGGQDLIENWLTMKKSGRFFLKDTNITVTDEEAIYLQALSDETRQVIEHIKSRENSPKKTWTPLH